LVTAGMTEDIIDLPEAVEVDVQNGEVFALLRSLFHRDLEVVRSGGAVRQLDKRVVICKIFDARFGTLSVRHVLDNIDEILRRTIGTTNGDLLGLDQPRAFFRSLERMIGDEDFGRRSQ
jgi:hypothetical protein